MGTLVDRHRISTILVLIVALLFFGSTLLFAQQNEARSLLTNVQAHPPKDLMIGNDDITLKFEGRPLNLNGSVVYKENRYYLPLGELILKMGGSIKREGQYIYVHFRNRDITINVPEERYWKDRVEFSFTVKPEGEDFRVSLIDLCRMFDFVSDWNDEDRVLGLYVNRNLQVHVPSTTLTSEKPALIRLEDISSGGPYYTSEALAKLRVIANYLYEENVPFHVAWVPRYIDPTKSIDRSIADQYSMLNADFVFTLDYIVSRDGVIGLHGYTHQYGDTITLKGTEFRSSYEESEIPDSDSYVRERLTKAIQAANTLSIPYGFFEAPHYVLSPKALRMAQNYFKVIYQSYPGIPDKIIQRDTLARKVMFVPTPLGYIHGSDDLERVFSKIKQKEPNLLASFYFHPFLEFRDISITRNNQGYPEMNYSRDSILHRLVEEFRRQGYTFMSIHQLRDR